MTADENRAPAVIQETGGIEEIGGYMELERPDRDDYYPELVRLNLGRTALMVLIRQLQCRRMFIPRYICDSVIHGAERAGCEVVLYGLDDHLEPLLDETDFGKEGDWLYIVNFYGQVEDEDLRRYRQTYGQIIVDHAQAFYQRPIDGIPTIYTPRKFFGISDGAYLYTGSPEETRAAAERLEMDHSAGRMKHMLGRLEGKASDYYKDMRDVSDTFAELPPMKMSPLTETILRGIDYDRVREKRHANYLTLKKLLPEENFPKTGWPEGNPFTRRTPEAPFAFPYYHANGVELRRFLASKKIYVPTNWSYLLEICDPESREYRWSADVLPLPLDQRYGEREMEVIVRAIEEFDQI